MILCLTRAEYIGGREIQFKKLFTWFDKKLMCAIKTKNIYLAF